MKVWLRSGTGPSNRDEKSWPSDLMETLPKDWDPGPVLTEKFMKLTWDVFEVRFLFKVLFFDANRNYNFIGGLKHEMG